jgi:hypothetical protein
MELVLYRIFCRLYDDWLIHAPPGLTLKFLNPVNRVYVIYITLSCIDDRTVHRSRLRSISSTITAGSSIGLTIPHTVCTVLCS